ncbi:MULTISPECIES: SNF2-related protein [unclassified Crossiella]|uniref:SNF2-related protein n=1 Tax=unclassified Crossiella TaxID=2620835 RepID=UPI001FFE5CAE|nr:MULTISPECIES: SNF2-related protein [unclassified Crossiella]MCK2245454.1 SNF2-related protein [Crossiella sp. S99.2]MCK2259106.1 SNF2-related protein [Crossiella sp. S99.1]
MEREIPPWLRPWTRGGCWAAGGEPEVLRRLESGSLTVKDLRALLLVPLGEMGQLRSRLLDYVSSQPHLAPGIFAVQSQFTGWPQPTIAVHPVVTGDGAAFRAQAGLHLRQGQIMGEWHTGPNKKTVSQVSCLSLLGRLVDIPMPRAQASAPTTTAATPPRPRQPLTIQPCPDRWVSLNDKAFLDVLTAAVVHEQLDEHLIAHTLVRARAGLLTAKHLNTVLIHKPSRVWDGVLRAALLAATRIPPRLAEFLNGYSASTGSPTGEFTDQLHPDGMKSASVRLVVDGQDRTFGPCRAVSRAAARQAVRLAALAELAGLPPREHWSEQEKVPSGWLVLTADRTPIQVLEDSATRTKTTLRWQDRSEPGHLRFQLDYRWAGRTFTATAEAPGIQQTRQTAAASIMLQVNMSHGRATPAAPATRVELAAATVTVPQPQRRDRHAAADNDPAPPASLVRQEPGTPHPAPPESDAAAVPPEPTVPARESDYEVPSAAAPPLHGTVTVEAPARLAGGHKAFRAALTAGHGFAFDSTAALPQAGLVCLGVPEGVPTEVPVVRHEVMDSQGAIGMVRCWPVATGDVIDLLSGPPRQEWSASARLWAQVVHLVLTMVSQHRVRPGLADTDDRRRRYPMWQLGPFTTGQQHTVQTLATELATQTRVVRGLMEEVPAKESVDLLRSVRAMADVLAHHLVISAGRPYLHGGAPYTAEVYLADPPTITAVQRWVDDLDVTAEMTTPPADGPYLWLCIKPPVQGQPVLEGTLRLSMLPDSPDSAVDAESVWWNHLLPDNTVIHGPDLREQVRRTLRLAGRTLPCLEALGSDPYPDRLWLDPADAAALCGSAAQTLRELGIRVQWHKEWATELAVEAVVGPAGSTQPVTGRLGLGELFDRRWRITAEGTVLTGAELDRLRDAELPWVMERNRWILVDDLTRQTLRRPAVETIPRYQGMLEVLDGWVTLDGRVYACTPAAGLAALISRLRETDYEEVIRRERAHCPIRLRDHQVRALAWIAVVSALGFGCVLADDMGLGKTITALAAHLRRDRAGADKPTLIICPNEGVLNHWEGEIARHAPTATTVRYWRTERTLGLLGPRTIVLTTYGVIDDPLTTVDWGLVVADEAQKTKNTATGAARRVRALRSETRLALTGTPMENRPGELWAILDWVNAGLLGTPAHFHAQFVRPILDAPDPEAVEQARQRVQRVVRPFVLRRLKIDPALGLNLPPKVETTHLVHLSERQQGQLESLDNASRRRLRHNSTGAPIGQLVKKITHDQRKIVNSPAQFLEQPLDDPALDWDELVHQSPKLARTRELLQALRGTGERALIFTNYVYAAQMVTAYVQHLGYRAGLYIGEVTEPARKALVADLTDGGIQVLVATFTTAALGLDLTAANHVIHFERHWNPAVEAQATDRAHRMNQLRPVHVHYLVTRNSVEDRLAALVAEKRDQSGLYLPDGEIDFSQLSADQLIRLANLTT